MLLRFLAASIKVKERKLSGIRARLKQPMKPKQKQNNQSDTDRKSQIPSNTNN